MGRTVTPLATYRLQLHAGFPFDAASAITDYLQALGVSHVYSSPYLQAAAGSMHGYDVVDHRRVNEELGGFAGHERFTQALAANHLGQVLDIVPNHMAITGRENAWWWDVLENGPASPYAAYFDVEWHSSDERLRNKMLLPVLGDHYGKVLREGLLRVERDGGSFSVRYYDHALPVAPRSLVDVLNKAAGLVKSDFLAFLADSLERLPRPTVRDLQRLFARHRDKEVIRGLLTRLLQERPEVGTAIDEVLKDLNANIDTLDSFLERQNFRIAFWKTAGRELGYRRFFDVNNLIGLRVEDEKVFADTHQLLLEWIDRGVLDGLRVDHPDGLRDPKGYFDRLAKAAPNAWVVAEKIIEPGERLCSDWAVAGTTGYDFLNVLNGVFVDQRAEDSLTELYGQISGEPTNYHEVVLEKKRLVLREILGSDVTRLAAYFQEICENDRYHRDYTRHDIHHAVRETITYFSVYRSYVRAEQGEITDCDRGYITEAVEGAKNHRTDLDPELFDFIGAVLKLEKSGDVESEFVMRYQQLTGPAMAKGVEDTAFYCYNRLVSLNEVGGDPGRFGVSTGEFHAFCADLQARHPFTMTTTSTHDTKRSEDVRARLNVLSEMPEIWREAVCRWCLANEHYRKDGLLDRNAEYLLYQTLVGAWPINAERLSAYMLKATREAKQRTSWITPNAAYEEALDHFVRAILADVAFEADVNKFVASILEPSRINSLSQTLIKLTAPGVPDLYQGTEIWNFALVDPDNRTPVDYDARRILLSSLTGLGPEQILERSAEGLPKLHLVKRVLELRRERQESFGASGSYLPLFASGTKAEHILSFSRGEDVVTVAQRLPYLRGSDWSDTKIALGPGSWRNRLTDEWLPGNEVTIQDLFRLFPVALLTRENQA